MADWVLAAERAYVAAAVEPAAGAAGAAGMSAGLEAASRTPAPAAGGGAAPTTAAYAIAAAGAIASRHLAVSTPRSFGIVIDGAGDAEAGALSLVAHRTWFAPRDIRCASTADGAAELAAATGGRVVAVEEALACDIASVLSTRVGIAPGLVRRGTHLNVSCDGVLAPALHGLATVVHDAGLPALAAGMVDGRQLDEITIFVADGAPIARAALELRAAP